jgi:hypothetical protein
VVVAGGAGGLGVLVGVGEGVGHRRCPELALRVDAVKRGQVSDQVRTTPSMVGVDQMNVAGVAVAHDGAGVAGQHLAGVDVVLGAAAGVHRGQELGAGGVDILQGAVGADWGLIDVQHPDLA